MALIVPVQGFQPHHPHSTQSFSKSSTPQASQELKQQLESARAALAAFSWQSGAHANPGGASGGGYLGLSESADASHAHALHNGLAGR